MKIVKQNAGITLVALIVTIILLLILAGITISLTVGQQGILRRAEEAGKNYIEAAKQEEKDLDKLYSSIKVAENSEITLTMKELNQYIEEKLADKVEELKQTMNTNAVDYSKAIDISSYTSEDNKFICPKDGTLLISFCGAAGGTKNCLVHITDFPLKILTTTETGTMLTDANWGVTENFSCLVNERQEIYFTFNDSQHVFQAYFVPVK